LHKLKLELRMEIEAILAKYPKTRVPLPEEQKLIYEKEYLNNREGANFMSSLAQKLESWMHVHVKRHTIGTTLLEIGAGTLNHMLYLDGQSISCVDIIEPQEFLYKDSPYKKLVHHVYKDIFDVQDDYDTIYSIATLEHITDLPKLVAKAGMLLKDDGVFLNGIPAEGGFLWGLSWRLSTGLAYRLRTGLSYAPLMRHEHVNNFDEIRIIIGYFFKHSAITYFPIHGKHLSFYAVIRAHAPDLARCREYLPSLNHHIKIGRN
jgi:SAM-dependent methyltransferase